MKNKSTPITSIAGQDGAYLAELLLKKSCVVHGLKRRSPLLAAERDALMGRHGYRAYGGRE